MITGRLLPDRRAVVPITVDGLLVPAVVDTGFDGGVTLPDTMRGRVLARVTGASPYQLGDGTVVSLPTYEVEIEVDGRRMSVEAIFSAGNEVILGVTALADYRLTIDYPAGVVTLERTRP